MKINFLVYLVPPTVGTASKLIRVKNTRSKHSNKLKEGINNRVNTKGGIRIDGQTGSRLKGIQILAF